MELGTIKKSILIITSGQPSLNPRLVKEADALTDAGYDVIVLYTYWNDWATKHDVKLLAEKKWKAIRTGGDPHQKTLIYFISRLIYKGARFITQKTKRYNYIFDLAAARSSYFLIKRAKKHKADLYIAHNLGGLPAAVKAAQYHKKPCGFDAEDFHRQETTDDESSYSFKLAKLLEDRYIPALSYLSTSSPLTAEKYELLYKRPVTCILNVFPKTSGISIVNNLDKPLKLFWFSQTIGPNRGLELIIQAIGQTTAICELHLLGQPVNGYIEELSKLAQAAGVSNYLYFYEPVSGDQIFRLGAQFDIGLASETNVCLNRNLSLTNKLFTYIQSGLAVAASNTLAQSAFIAQYPQIGKIYNNTSELSDILTKYDQNRASLLTTKNAAFKIGQNELNWEIESHKFLSIVKTTLKQI